MSAGIAGFTGCVLLVGLAFRTGGYFPDSHLKAAAVAFAVLAVLLAVRPPSFTVSTPALLALASLGGLAAWTALSSRWSSLPDVALEDFQRTLLYLGLFGLGLVAAGSGRYSRHLVWAVGAVAAAIVLTGLASRLWPGSIPSAAAPDSFAGYRLSYPLSYWNAFGTLGALVVVLCIGLAADARLAPVVRGLLVTVAVLAGVAAYLSFSRGGWLAFMVGLVVLVALSARRMHLLVALALVGGAVTLAILRLRVFPALTDDPARGAGQAADGHSYAPQLIGLAVAAGAAQTVLAALRLRDHTRAQLSILTRRMGPYFVGLALVVAGIAYVATAPSVEGHAATSLDRLDRWVSKQWDEFMAPATFSAAGASRLTTARGTRSDLYRVALDGFAAHPLQGDGSGGFQVRFAHDRRVDEKVRDAHSLYFETLDELGLVGALLVIGLTVAVIWAAVIARRRARTLARQQGAAATAAVAVVLAHSAVDWDWQMPALMGVALMLAAALFPAGAARRRRRSGRDQAFITP